MSAVESTIFKSILKPDESPHKFTPRETSKIQHEELSKTVYSHISNLHGLIVDWNKNRVKGYRVARQIRNLNLPLCDEDYIPSELGPLMDNLLDTFHVLQNIVEEMKLLSNKLKALAKLQRSDEPVLVTWSVKNFSENVLDMYENAEKELELLETATENMGHCRDAHILVIYMQSWGPGTYFCSKYYSSLFLEASLPPLPCPSELSF